MRDIFIKELISEADNNDNIFLIVGDLGFKVVEPFAKKFPNRFLNAGVAEQNMMGMAAGLASEGKHVFVYSIANFPTFRCAEQVRNDVDYHNFSVTIVAVGAGLSYGNLGYSHHAVQDYSLMRVMPNILIASPGDSLEVVACTRYLSKSPQPSYLRLDKAQNLSFHSKIPNLKPGKWQEIIKSKNNKIFLTTGNTIFMGLKLLKQQKYKDYGIYSLPLWGFKFKKVQKMQLIKFTEVITIEDHLKDAGFGSWLVESSPINFKSQIINLGLNEKILGKVANQKTLNRIGGLY